MEPFTKYRLSDDVTIIPAKAATVPPAAKVAWTVKLPDRIDGITTGNRTIVALAHDGTHAQFGIAFGDILMDEVVSKAGECA